MQKIVISTCHGGFGISWDTFLFLEEHGHPIVEDMFEKWAEYSDTLYFDDPARDDPLLVLAVEELGRKVASGDYACLKVVEIPDDVEWQIDEYDGWEWVAEKHRTWG